MNIKRKALWIAIAIAAAGLAMSAATRAQDEYGFEDKGAAEKAKPVYENYIELGAGVTDDGNGKFGEYTSGINNAYTGDGGFGAGGFRFGGGEHDSGRSWTIEAGTGNARVFEARYGVQGDYGLTLIGDRIRKYEYGDARTVYWAGADADISKLPPGYIRDPGDSSATPPRPPYSSSGDPAFYTAEDIATDRDILGIKGFKSLSDCWTVSLDYQDQSKTGDNTLGGNQGFNGTGLVPSDVDTDTKQMTARVAFARNNFQNGVDIYLSKFENESKALSFENANYGGIGVEQIAQEPDNQFLRVGMDGGYNFDPRTRISWFGDWSRGEQDDDFLPIFLTQGYYDPSMPQTFSPTSLDGEVERSSLRLALVGRPFSRFDYRVQYEYKNKDTKGSPLPAYLVSYRAGTTAEEDTNQVYDKETQRFALEAGYRFSGKIRLRAGYTYQQIDRDTDEIEYPAPGMTEVLSFTDSTDEDRLWGVLTIAATDELSIKLRGEYSQISADLSSETADGISPGGDPYRATPVFLLDRDQDLWSIEADYALGHDASVYLSYDLRRDDYDNDTQGLDSRDADVWNAGISWSLSAAATLSAYAGYEKYQFDQHGRQMPVGGDPTPYFVWGMDTEDEVDSAGVSLDWEAVENRFDLKADLVYLSSDSGYSSSLIDNQGIDFTTTPAPLFGDMPDSNDQLLRFSLVGKYHYTEHIDISGRYVYEDRQAEDWAWTTDIAYIPPAAQGSPPVVPNTAQVVAFGWQRPDYSSNLFVVAVRYKF